MRIKSIDLFKFGIFNNHSLSLSPGFTLIYGDNEKGKTTVLDGILVGLFAKVDKRSGQLRNIPPQQKRRYGEDIVVKVIAEVDGKEIGFPTHKNFEDAFGIALKDVLSIFIVREGELKLAEKKDFGRWWNSLKAKLLGFEEEPGNVLRKIAQTAQLTENLALPRHVLARVEENQKKLDWFRDNEPRIKEFRKKVRDREDLNRKEKSLTHEIEQKRKGQRKAVLLKAKNLYQELENKRKKVNEDYARYRQVDAEEWERLERERDVIAGEIKSCQDQLIDRNNNRKQKEEEIGRLSDDIADLNQRLHYLESEEPKLDRALQLQGNLQHTWRIPAFAPWMSWGLTLFALTLGATFASLFLYILVAILLFASGTLTLLFLHQLKKQKRLQELTTSLMAVAKNAGLKIEGLEELRESVQTLRTAKNEKATILDRIKDEELPAVRKDIEKLERRKLEAETKLERINYTIRDLCARTGLSELSQLKAKLQEKRELLTDIEKKLKPHLHQLLKANESDWPFKLKELEELEGVDPIEDEGALVRIEQQRERCRRKRVQIHEEIIRLEEALQNKFGCRRIEEVYWKVEELQREIEDAEITQRAGAKVKQVFERLLAASDDILKETITQGKASTYFAAFTAGNYSAIELSNYSLQAKDRNGQMREFDDLSTATRDQLLTAIRLALAERLLHSKGFLIFDEAFVTSDRRRLQQQMQLLADLTQQGWQIIYLTAKEDAKEEVERLQQMNVKTKIVNL